MDDHRRHDPWETVAWTVLALAAGIVMVVLGPVLVDLP